MRGTVLITGARAPVALDLARAIRSAGIEVHLADSVRPHAARALRPAFPVHRLPPPRQAFADFRRVMRDLMDRTGAGLIIPTCEEVFWLARAAELDGSSDRLFAPSTEVLRRLHSKIDFPALAGSLGLAVPETVAICGPINPATLPTPSDEMVFKPEFSRFGTEVLIRPDGTRLDRIQPSPERRWAAQRFVAGQEVCSWAAAHDGQVSAFVAYRPRRRLGRGAAYQIEAVSNPQLRQAAETIAAATGMSGHLSFDAIEASDGRTYLIECNPRAVSGLHLFDASADLGHAVVGAGDLAEPPQGRLRHLGPAMALLGIPSALSSADLPGLIRDWRGSADVMDRGEGPGVSLGCLLDAAGFAAAAITSSRSPAGATTSDIEWNGEVLP